MNLHGLLGFGHVKQRPQPSRLTSLPPDDTSSMTMWSPSKPNMRCLLAEARVRADNVASVGVAAENESRARLRVRKLFDELVELGGIPPRSLVEYRFGDLTDEQRGDDDGEEFMTCRYLDQWWY